MNEFDHIVREAMEIFDFYGMNHKKPVIDEILYNHDYLLRVLFRDNELFDENLKTEVPPLNMIQHVFNSVNTQFSWIVAGNQGGYDKNQLANAKTSMEDIFYVPFAKPPDENTPSDDKRKDDNT